MWIKLVNMITSYSLHTKQYHVYCDVMGQFPFGMMSMLSGLNIKHTGRHHSGIDDCHNIANILCELIRCGAALDITGNIK
ncbi:unnamed protein product [Schistosoma guineensis]|nr:unnamed protein product [Schistosoma guineensis]